MYDMCLRIARGLDFKVENKEVRGYNKDKRRIIYDIMKNNIEMVFDEGDDRDYRIKILKSILFWYCQRRHAQKEILIKLKIMMKQQSLENIVTIWISVVL